LTKIDVKVGDAAWWFDFKQNQRRPVSSIDFYQINKTIRTMEDKVARKVVIAGLRKGAVVFRNAAKKQIPVRQDGEFKRLGRSGLRAPGFLSRGIIYRADPKRMAYIPKVRIGPRTSAFYGYFFETGRRRTRFPIRRYLTHAFMSSQDEAIRAITRGMWAALRKAQGR
jgi:hypothetical protein